MSKPEAVNPPAATKTRSPKRSQEQIEADLKAQLARIEAKKHVETWATSKLADLIGLSDATDDSLRALGRLLLEHTK